MAGSRLSGERGRREIELHETHLEDQLAALQYLQALPYVDRNRIGVMGASFGGIQTMLAVERSPGYRVAVNCSGAAETWRGASHLRSRLTADAEHYEEASDCLDQVILGGTNTELPALPN